MSKSIVFKGLELLDSGDESAGESSTKKKARSKDDGQKKESDKWGLRKKRRQDERARKDESQKGKVKYDKLVAEKRLSRLERLRRKQSQNPIQHNLDVIKRMTARRKLSKDLQECFNLPKSSRQPESENQRDQQSVFTDADFESFARSYKV